MRLKVRYSTFLVLMLILIYIAQNKWLYILSVPINRVYMQVGFSLLGLFAVNRKKMLVYKDRMLFGWIGSFLIVYLVQTFISSIKYEQGVFKTFLSEAYYFVILSYFLLIAYMQSEKNKQTLEEIICQIGLIVELILIVHVYVLMPRGLNIFQINYGNRMNSIRVITSQQIIEVSTLLGFSIFNNHSLSPQKRINGLVSTVLGMLCSIFIGMTRMSIMILALSLSLMYIMASKGYTMKALFKKCSSVFIVLFLLNCAINSELVSKFVAEFSVFGSDTYSIRLYEIQHAISTLKQDAFSVIFGTGFVTIDNSQYSYVVNGNNMFFGRTDIGVLGFVHEFGLIGFILVFVLTIVLVKRYIGIRKNGLLALDYLGLLSYYVLGMGTLFMMNIERITYFPILLAISSFYIKNGGKVRNGTETKIVES